MRPRPLGWFRIILGFIVILFVVFALWATHLGTRWPSFYYMTGPSMEPTVKAHEYFLARAPAGPIEAGDLVIFRYEDEDGVFHVLRRVAAMPGDTVSMDSGVVILNGEPQPWPYQIIKPAAYRSPLDIEGELYNWGPWVVPPDSIVLLSDTRDIVRWPDSRFLGFIALEDILAKAAVTLTGRRF